MNRKVSVARQCSIPNCGKYCVEGGVCISHGARRQIFLEQNCNKPAKQFDKCSAHGPKRRNCSIVGCGRTARKGGHCTKHGAPRNICIYTDCQKWAIARGNGMCTRHKKKNSQQKQLCPFEHGKRHHHHSLFQQQRQQQRSHCNIHTIQNLPLALNATITKLLILMIAVHRLTTMTWQTMKTEIIVTTTKGRLPKRLIWTTALEQDHHRFPFQQHQWCQ